MLRRTTTQHNLWRATPLCLSIPLDSHEKPLSVGEIKTNWQKVKDTVRRYNPFTDQEAFRRMLNKRYEGDTFNERGIKNAASIILLAPDDFEAKPFARHDGNTSSRMKMLFVKRSKQMKFMPNLYVFPGGKVDAEDIRSLSEDEHVQQQVLNHRGGAMPWVARRITVLRELFEEVGVVLDGHGNLREKKYYHFSVQNLSALVPFAHWVTPVQEPRRFDAAFFLCKVPPASTQIHLELSEGEIADAKWLTPEEAVYMHNDPHSDFRLPPPTQLMVHQLAQYPSVTSACWHYQCRHQNDLLEMPTAEPFVDVSDGNFNMHFKRDVMPDMPCGHHVYELGYPIPPVFLKHNKDELAKIKEQKRIERMERGLAPEEEEEEATDKKDGAAAAAEEEPPSPEAERKSAKMVVHVGSPLMEPTNDLLEREYDKEVDHRKKAMPVRMGRHDIRRMG